MLAELTALVRLKLQTPLHQRGTESKNLVRCWEFLKLTSRSFAAVIEQLHPEMREPVMIFYLVLRALDTIEDDMGLDNNVKVPLLRGFRDVLKTKDWTFDKSSITEKDRIVLIEFDVILREFHKLKPVYQDIIADITHKMGNGMADYIDLENQTNYDGVATIADYDLYCHHVAGIVGEGCTRMAIAANFSTPTLGDNPQLYESMGLFLQKTNIIRDYREDQDDGRSFWPREVWSKYANSLSDFIKPEHRAKGLECVTDLTLLSLNHVTQVLEYLSNITDPSYFMFCAIPQVMSIATLELVFQNPDIFDRNVKIRKGLACKLILESTGMQNVFTIFRQYVRKIHARNNPKDPHFFEIELKCGEIEMYINAHSENYYDHWIPESQRRVASANDDGFMSESNLVLLAGIGGVLVTGLIMITVAWCLGAEYVAPQEFKDEISRFIEFFFKGNDDAGRADYKRS